MNRCLAGLAIAVLAGTLTASPDGGKAPAKKPDPVDRWADLWAGVPDLDRTSRYLERVAALRKRRADAGRAGQADLRGMLDQLLAAEEAAVGQYHEAMRLTDSGFPAVQLSLQLADDRKRPD